MPAQVNGNRPSSKFISHATSYPVVSDGIETFKQNPYGKKSLELADGAYQKFGKPVQGYLETPYSYVKPYVAKADEMADAGLGYVDSKVPIVKEDTHTVIDTAKQYAFWPYSYAMNTWNDEYHKTANHNNRGPGYVTAVMAIISTELRIASDFFHAVADFVGPKYEQGKKKGSDYVRQAQDQAGQYKQVGQDKLNDITSVGQQKVDEYSKVGQQKAQQAKDVANAKKDEAKDTAQGAKDEAAKKAGQK
ncbi:Pathogenesis associated protein Cap20 [Teratosphaeria destructans]|uniref:Pathogenesis associated protein Cap20 n=1 Tax=Teratosphaeria destructans TaxID=418781 RepID=A0A9W7SLL3_9PEZI|nr:Pathogenesis associated protein Cap20 [Teratosphaeria destructans]